VPTSAEARPDRARAHARLSLALFSFVLTACASDPDLEIEYNQAPQTSCDLEGSGERLAAGTFDFSVGAASSYVLTPVVRNRGGAEVTWDHVRVELFLDAPDGISRFAEVVEGERREVWEIDLCGRGPCPTTRAVGTSTFEVPILPRSVASFYQDQLLAVLLSGRTPGVIDMIVRMHLVTDEGEETPQFEYPVTLCLGCLVTFPEGSDDPRRRGEDCCAGTPRTSCYPGQDEAVDCQVCRETTPEICNYGHFSCGG